MGYAIMCVRHERRFEETSGPERWTKMFYVLQKYKPFY